MIVGIPKEVKNNEFRAAATPSGVHKFTRAGHVVICESGAGLGSGISDADYVSAAAKIVNSADEVWVTADLILKVKNS